MLNEINKKIEEIDKKIKEILDKGLEELQETEVYTRIVGYHRAITSWNKGKKEEYKARTPYEINEGELKDNEQSSI